MTYLFTEAFPTLAPQVVEGLCELAQYLWLRDQRRPEVAYRLKLLEDNPDPICGEGFRLAQEALRWTTVGKLLARVKASGDLRGPG